VKTFELVDLFSRMPKCVQQVTGKSYSFIEPRLGWARSKISLLDGACGKLGNIVTPVIATADKCIDTTFDVVTAGVSAARVSVVNRVAPLQDKLGHVQGVLVVRSLDLVVSSEQLIDRLLPLPPSKASDDESDQDKKTDLTAYRLGRLPFAVPFRVTMIMYVKANGAVDSVLLSGRHVAGVAAQKQNQFAQQIMRRTKPLTDRVHARRASAVQTLDTGRQMVIVRVNNVVIKLHLVEAKDWSAEKASSLKSGTKNVVMAMARGAHGTTTRVVGPERATYLFEKLRLPVEDSIQEDEVKSVTCKDDETTTSTEHTPAKEIPTEHTPPKEVQVNSAAKTAIYDAHLEGAIAG